MSYAILTTPRLKMRAFNEQDVLPFHRILNQPNLLRYFSTSDPPSLEQVERMVTRLIKHWDEHGFGIWALESLATGELIGRSGLFAITEKNEVEIDFILATVFWGQGLATEAGRAGLHFGFESIGLPAIIGIVHPENKASQRLLEKIGLHLTRADNYFGMDCLRYEIIKPT